MDPKPSNLTTRQIDHSCLVAVTGLLSYRYSTEVPDFFQQRFGACAKRSSYAYHHIQQWHNGEYERPAESGFGSKPNFTKDCKGLLSYPSQTRCGGQAKVRTLSIQPSLYLAILGRMKLECMILPLRILYSISRIDVSPPPWGKVKRL
ncbi:hypothetical protein TNCV_2245221 [Trichonephila clavipes]|nr:hypothetical protein TNCV_2245221 [Trichonephila clavipes]